MTDPILDVQSLCKSFGSLRASDDLSFTVKRGEIHALIGPNGAGKTTTIGQLSGEIQSDSGRVIFDGRDISNLKTFRRARLGLQRSYQVTSLFPDFNVIENLAIALQAHDAHSFRFWKPAREDTALRNRARDALVRGGLGDKLEIPAKNLAHGEQRQLELSMALATEPTMLLLDEPMAGMGRNEGQQLMELIRGLRGHMSILLVEHDMDIVFALADMVTVLVKGSVMASGAPDEIRANAEVRRAYLGDED
jgi:branched-chain amino acid transport system ATP-binding protein